MTVSELSKQGGFKLLALPSPDEEIKGVYAGDLLSWVMGKAMDGDLWATIMSNLNIIAVATLSNLSCIVLTEGVVPDEDVIKVAMDKGINLLSTELTTYQLCAYMHGLLK